MLFLTHFRFCFLWPSQALLYNIRQVQMLNLHLNLSKQLFKLLDPMLLQALGKLKN